MQKKKGFGCLKRIIAGMLALCLVIPDLFWANQCVLSAKRAINSDGQYTATDDF